MPTEVIHSRMSNSKLISNLLPLLHSLATRIPRIVLKRVEEELPSLRTNVTIKINDGAQNQGLPTEENDRSLKLESSPGVQKERTVEGNLQLEPPEGIQHERSSEGTAVSHTLKLEPVVPREEDEAGNFQFELSELSKVEIKEENVEVTLKLEPSELVIKEESSIPGSSQQEYCDTSSRTEVNVNSFLCHGSDGPFALSSNNVKSCKQTKELHRCTTCKKSFTRMYSLYRHKLRKCSPALPYPGESADTEIRSSIRQERSRPKSRVMHSGLPFSVCKMSNNCSCLHTDAGVQSCDPHGEADVARTLHRCSFCQEVFVQMSCLERHIQAIHSCFPPAAGVSSDPACLEHTNLGQQNHNHEEEFLQNSYLFGHVKVEHAVALPEPQNTSTYFKYANTGNQHTTVLADVFSQEADSKQIIVRERPHACNVCNKTFMKRSHLNRHMKERHLGSVVLCCPICARRFSNVTSLKLHNRVHAGERPHLCNVCNKTFLRKSHLNRHTRVQHLGSRSFACPLCAKCFTNSTNLKLHNRVHTGERPFLCVLCEKSFRQKSALALHIRVHNGEKPFSCGECGRSFIDKSTLRVHTRIHSGERPYTCSICNKGFSRKRGIASHVKHHIEGSTPRYLSSQTLSKCTLKSR